jgi:hypothetical protein
MFVRKESLSEIYIAAGDLIGLRRDIARAVLGSRRLVLTESVKSMDAGRNYFHPTQNISQLAQNRSKRLFLVTDKMDKRVRVVHKTGLIDRLRRAGRQVPQFFVEAIDDYHHGIPAVPNRSLPDVFSVGRTMRSPLR